MQTLLVDNPKDYIHPEIKDGVKNIAFIISNNLHALRMRLYLNVLYNKTEFAKLREISQADIENIFSECCLAIKNSLHDKYHPDDAREIAMVVDQIMFMKHKINENKSEENYHNLNQLLITLELHMKQKIKNIIYKKEVQEYFGKYLKLALKYFLNIDTIIDAGANGGQYAKKAFSLGYNGIIHSFEPVSVLYHALENQKNSHNYQWYTHYQGLGEKQESKTIYVSKHSACSTLNPYFQKELLCKDTDIARETLQLDTLDHYLEQNNISFKNGYLKIDVENYEKEVLLGSRETINRIKALEIETRFIYYSTNQWLASDIITYLNPFRLHPIQLFDQVLDISCASYYGCDLIFIKQDILEELSWMISLQKIEKRAKTVCERPSCGIHSWI